MSQKSLGRKSLGVLLAERLKNDIANGVWVDRLPGYRILSSYYQVSDHTSRNAVDLLEKMGVLEAPRQGKKRAILKSNKFPEKKLEKYNLLIIKDSTIPLDRAVEHMLTEMIEFWLRRSSVSGDVKQVSGDLTRYKQPESLLQQWIDQNDATHILLFNASVSWVHAVDQLNFPCYYLGGALKEAEIPLARCQGSSQQMNATFKLVFERLKRMGHTRLLIPYERTLAYNRERVLKMMSSVYQGVLSKDMCDQYIPVFQESNAQSWQTKLEKEILRLQSTVVIVGSHFELVSLYAYCTRKGIRLGKELMMICLYSEDVLDWYYPRPTYMKYPYEKSIKDFKGWVRAGCPFREHTVLEMEWVEGETL